MPSIRKVFWATMGFLQQRKRAYMISLGDPNNRAAQAVLKDLARFCYATDSCMVADVRVHAFNEGKRAVWLRIQQHLNLPEHDLYTLYGGPKVDPQVIHQPNGDDDVD